MKYSIGIDIGGTHIHGIIMDEDGTVIKKIIFETHPEHSREKIIRQIISAIKTLDIKKSSGIGLGIAGITDKNGKFLFNPNIPKLKNVNLKKILQEKFKTKVIQENDANCFAIAEHRFGAGKGTKNMVGLIIGTGVGGGIILNKRLYKGSHGFAGKFGHSILNPNGPRCNCGLKGDFESLCSGPNIVKRYYNSGGKTKNADPKKIFQSKEDTAKKIIQETINSMAIGISHIANSLDLDLIVLGGGVSNLDFYKRLNIQLKKYSNAAVRKKIKVAKNKIGDFSGAVGAAFIARN